MKRFVYVALLLLSGLPAQAREPLPPDLNRVTAELAAPPIEGTVSIGVFDKTGKCVRVLYKNTVQDRIPAALNGYLVTWDGKNDAGMLVEKGEYEIRGVTVGDVTIEGEAWHFNDWHTDSAERNPSQIAAVRLLENGDFVILDPAGWLFRYHFDGQLAWSTPVPEESFGLAVLADRVCVCSPRKVVCVDLETGSASEPSPTISGLISLASSNDALLGIIDGNLIRFDPVSLEPAPVAIIPTGARLLAVRSGTVIVSDGTDVFKNVTGQFEKLSLPPHGPITWLAIGIESTFWVSTVDATLTQFDLNGNARRGLDAEGEDAFTAFDVSRDDRRIALVSIQKKRLRLRLLEPAPSTTPDVSLWKTTLQRDLEPCASFGIDPATGELVAIGELPRERTATVSLIENPLFPGRKDSLEMTASALPNGVWLATSGGLPLVPIAANLTSQRIVLVWKNKSAAFRCYLENSGAVAEFSIRGLANMMQFSSGKLQWPPGPRQAADEKNVPSNEPAPTPE